MASVEALPPWQVEDSAVQSLEKIFKKIIREEVRERALRAAAARRLRKPTGLVFAEDEAPAPPQDVE